ncbi:MAG: DNA-directed RNA polymerase subunit alpha [Fimbriimonadaceae bacterium]
MPHITTLELKKDYGKFVLEPLERGYGQTIGNALRRVLLSSIQGAAICAVRIEKVFHEFAPIPGVKEDATQLLLNLHDVAIRFDDSLVGTEVDKVLRIEVKGPGKVLAADIQCPEGVTVVNPDVYLATISDPDATLAMDLYVGWGVGYVLPEKQEKYRGIIGVIPVGAQFTPVKRVGYNVEQTRVGMRTDFERLTLDVWTNGALSPNDAVSQAAHILEKYFRLFFELGASGFEAGPLGDDALEGELLNVPDVNLEELGFTQRTYNALRRSGLMTLKALLSTSEADLRSIRGFGVRALEEVREKLAERGYELRPGKASFRAPELDDEGDEG